MRTSIVVLLVSLAVQMAAGAEPPQPAALPVRGLHVSAPAKKDIPALIQFIREPLVKEGVNTLVIEFNFRFDFQSRPEFADPSAPNKDDVRQIVAACRSAGIQLIPQINCLGHQSWAKHNGRLLEKHPEFDETPGKYPNNEGIYCRSYCPLHPGVHEVVFDLMDELAEVCEADALHVGMDEVFLLGEEDCSRCKGKNKAELFAQEVQVLRDHLARSNRTLWMWGDRFLDGKTTGIGKWEASLNDTHPALRLVPKDIVICDWHYEKAVPTAAYFATEGFGVVSSPWRKPEVALGQLEMIRAVRKHANEAIAARMQGVLQTTWCGVGPFVKAYYGEDSSNARALEAVRCFRELFKELREGQGK